MGPLTAESSSSTRSTYLCIRMCVGVVFESLYLRRVYRGGGVECKFLQSTLYLLALYSVLLIWSYFLNVTSMQLYLGN